MQTLEGTRLGPYEILSLVGAGGMGQVYRARDTRLGREIALKVLNPSLAADAGAVARFEREARAVAALNHPNILALHDVGQENSTAYVVTELLDGSSLRERLAEDLACGGGAGAGPRCPLRRRSHRQDHEIKDDEAAAIASTHGTGVASVSCTPNCIAGSYSVTATPLTATASAAVPFTNHGAPCRHRAVRH
jgi:serine/threonine protein kinase